MGKYIIKKGGDGQFYFNFTATNGRIIVASEGYASKQGCKDGIASVKGVCTYDSRYDRKDAPYNYRFNLHAWNGEIVARSSEGYTYRADRENAIDIMKKEGPDAPIVDLS